MLCTAKMRLIVLQSRSLVHNTASSGHVTGHFGCATIFESKIAQLSGVINRQFFSNTV